MSDDHSPGAAEERPTSVWRSLRTFLFGEENEATLREEIEEAIDSHEGEATAVGDLSPVERQMLRNLLHFGESRVADIAVPRSDIIAVPSDISFAALVTAFAEAGHSRLPVFEQSLDSVVGMAHVKDVFALLVAGAEPPSDIATLLREPLYVPESMGGVDLLGRVGSGRGHPALVVDGCGGTVGVGAVVGGGGGGVGDIE